MSNQFASTFGEWEHIVIIALSLMSLGVIVFSTTVLMLVAWREKAVRVALQTEQKRQMEAQERAAIAQRQKCSELEHALHVLHNDVNALKATFPALHEGPWLPSLANDWCWSFIVELKAIDQGLLLLGTQIASSRGSSEDLDVYKAWVADLRGRYQLFCRNSAHMQQELLHKLSDLRTLYMEIGSLYCEVWTTPVYRHIPGMLHMAEVMLDETSSIPPQVVGEYVDAIAKQVEILAVRFEKGVLEEERMVWVNRIGKTPHLDALLENAGLGTC